ncbi:hypothetical protein AB1Y20_008142 [Prymnesium parvum]|uniref:JmjC domain-containing protein n=1 Tax=Prymnesium parvum TaxID=97485 RepID=A0AB34ITD6_PRYPA
MLPAKPSEAPLPKAPTHGSPAVSSPLEDSTSAPTAADVQTSCAQPPSPPHPPVPPRARGLEIEFLKAAQAGRLDEVQAMLSTTPSLISARSSSKGYSAMHFAAMGGATALIEWLAQRGSSPDEMTPSGVSPLQVALEYKRLPAARLLQRLRDSSRGTATNAPNDSAHPHRPAPRHPAWMASGGIRVHELHGSSASTIAEAERLVSRGAAVVWRGAKLCAAFPTAMRTLGIDDVRLDTNVSPRADRRFVYFSPERLERGPYDPASTRQHFAPMLLNQQLPFGEVTARHERQARAAANGEGSRGEATTGAVGADAASGWAPPSPARPGEEAMYVMAKLLESITASEVEAIRSAAKKAGKQLPAEFAPVPALGSSQWLIWTKELRPIARPIVDGLDWSRVAQLVKAAEWHAFEHAGLLVSGRDYLTPAHYDAHHNIFLQLAGAKRWLLFGADQTPRLYGFPALHALDPLSRVDLEAGDGEIADRWPLASEVRGTSVIVESGDVLILPQGVWHQVQSLDPHNVSVNLLFKKSPAEFGVPLGPPFDGVPPLPHAGRLCTHRRSAAFSELAKALERLVGAMVGESRAASVLQALVHDAAQREHDSQHKGDDPQRTEEMHDVLSFVRAVLKRSLANELGKLVMGVDAFLLQYFDLRRFAGLQLSNSGAC